MRYVKYAIAASVVIIASPASAGTGHGYIHHITPVANSVVIATDTHEGQPSCDGYNAQFEINITTDSGKAFPATLLSAANAKKFITIEGTGTCAAGGAGREGINYVQVDY